MKSKLTKKDGNIVEIEYNISFEELEPYIQIVYKRDKAKYSIPGFRKGKAPRKIIELNYGKGVFYEDAINEMINDIYPNSVEEYKLEPIDYPKFNIKNMEEEVVLSALIEVRPTVSLGQYKELFLEEEKVEVKDEEVEDILKQEQKKNATIKTIDERASKEGDKVEIKVLDNDETFTFTLGDEDKKEFNEAITGMKVEEVKTISIAEEEKEVKLLSILEEVLPAIDDELAKDVSEFDTLEEYKKDIKEKLLENKAKQQLHEYKEKLLDMAIENMEVEVPKTMIDNELEMIYENLKRDLSQNGITMEMYESITGQTKEIMMEGAKDTALRSVKKELLLKAIVEEEKIDITSEMIDEEIKEQAKLYNMEEEKVREAYSHNNYSFLKEQLSYRKAFELIYETRKKED